MFVTIQIRYWPFDGRYCWSVRSPGLRVSGSPGLRVSGSLHAKHATICSCYPTTPPVLCIRLLPSVHAAPNGPNSFYLVKKVYNNQITKLKWFFREIKVWRVFSRVPRTDPNNRPCAQSPQAASGAACTPSHTPTDRASPHAMQSTPDAAGRAATSSLDEKAGGPTERCGHPSRPATGDAAPAGLGGTRGGSLVPPRAFRPVLSRENSGARTTPPATTPASSATLICSQKKTWNTSQMLKIRELLISWYTWQRAITGYSGRYSGRLHR